MAEPLTVSQFTDSLGGTSKAAEIFGVLPSAVSNWRSWNRMPEHVYRRARKAAEDHGVPFSDELFDTATRPPAPEPAANGNGQHQSKRRAATR